MPPGLPTPLGLPTPPGLLTPAGLPLPLSAKLPESPESLRSWALQGLQALMRGGDEVLVGDVDPSVLLDYVLGEEDESALIDYLTAFLGESAAGFGVELAERRRQLRSYK